MVDSFVDRRSRSRWLGWLLSLGLLLPGCGSRSVPETADGGEVDRGGSVLDRGVVPEAGRDRGVRPDARRPPDLRPLPDRSRTDGFQPPPPDLPVLPPDQGPVVCSKTGHACLTDKDCCATADSCVSTFAGARVCTRPCTRDNPNTPLINEDSCPSAGTTTMCADIAAPPSSTPRCLLTCTPTTGKHTCPSKLACHPMSVIMTQSVDKAVCGFPACQTAGDCPVYLTKLCAPASPIAQCSGQPAGSFCAPHYTGSFTGRCALSGACDTNSGLCLPHKLGIKVAKVGDPCTDDRDCGGQMECLQEAITGGTAYFRNGYCTVVGCAFASTLKDRACPAGSTCSRVYYAGRCLKTCDLQKATTCRGHSGDKHGDYECRAWDLYSKQIAASPVCEPGHVTLCSTFAGSSISCANLGLSGNPTNMSCRDQTTGKKLATYDPAGVCLDDTASGPK